MTPRTAPQAHQQFVRQALARISVDPRFVGLTAAGSWAEDHMHDAEWCFTALEKCAQIYRRLRSPYVVRRPEAEDTAMAYVARRGKVLEPWRMLDQGLVSPGCFVPKTFDSRCKLSRISLAD